MFCQLGLILSPPPSQKYIFLLFPQVCDVQLLSFVQGLHIQWLFLYLSPGSVNLFCAFKGLFLRDMSTRHDL